MSGMQKVWPRIERRALGMLWRLLAWKARDVTRVTVGRSCLIVAPHADDETLGCGGLAILKRAAGVRVDVIVATDGAATHPGVAHHKLSGDDIVALREEETQAACAVLGIAPENVRFLRYPDGALATRALDLEKSLALAIAEISPEEIYVCSLADGHRDHVALARAVRSLASDGRLAGARLWEYPVWYWDYRSWRPAGTTNKHGFVLAVAAMLRAVCRTPVVAVSIRSLLAQKREALDCHRSQLGRLEEEPNWEGLPECFLENFFRDWELFFPLETRPSAAEDVRRISPATRLTLRPTGPNRCQGQPGKRTVDGSVSADKFPYSGIFLRVRERH